MDDNTDQRARVIVCLTAHLAHHNYQVIRGLEAEGYDVASTSSLGLVPDLVAAAESVLVVSDETSCQWLKLITDMLRDSPRVRPVLIAELDSPEEFLAAIAAGVLGFCSPDSSVDAIVRTVKSVEEHGNAIPRSMVMPLVDEIQHGRGHRVCTADGELEITDREAEILQLLLQRRSTSEMAGSLCLSVGTVRSHVSSLLKKLGACNRDDAIAMIEHAGGAFDQ